MDRPSDEPGDSARGLLRSVDEREAVFWGAQGSQGPRKHWAAHPESG